MTMILNALLPILLVIGIGNCVARLKLITGEQWHGIEKIAYFVLFPALLISTVAKTDFMALPAFEMAGAMIGSILIMAAVCLALRPFLCNWFSIDGPRYTSIFQGALRWNSFVALALADELMGSEGLALLAVAMVAMIPLLNVLCVTVLSRYAGSGEAPGLRKIGRDLLRNPLILSVLIGIVINASGLPLPHVMTATLSILGQAALPIGIVCVGATLDLGALRRPGPALASAAILKLVIMPLIAFGLCQALSLNGPAFTAVIIAMAVPTASGAFLLARQMGGDAKLMAEIITFQTVLAMVSMPLALMILT